MYVYNLGSKSGVATAPGAHTLGRSLVTAAVLRREQHFGEAGEDLPPSGNTVVASEKKLTRRTKSGFLFCFVLSWGFFVGFGLLVFFF